MIKIILLCSFLQLWNQSVKVDKPSEAQNDLNFAIAIERSI